MSNSINSDNTNPFTFFNLDISIFINQAELQANYQRILESLHPDNYAQEDNFMRDSAAKLSSFANDAYQTLQDPIKKCLAAISAKGWRAPTDNTIQDVNLLQEMMELQEMAASGQSLQNFYDDALVQFENSLQTTSENNALQAFSRLSFLNRLLLK